MSTSLNNVLLTFVWVGVSAPGRICFQLFEIYFKPTSKYQKKKLNKNFARRSRYFMCSQNHFTINYIFCIVCEKDKIWGYKSFARDIILCLLTRDTNNVSFPWNLVCVHRMSRSLYEIVVQSCFYILKCFLWWAHMLPCARLYFLVLYRLKNSNFDQPYWKSSNICDINFVNMHKR
jgi:hypothetical protein